MHIINPKPHKTTKHIKCLSNIFSSRVPLGMMGWVTIPDRSGSGQGW